MKTRNFFFFLILFFPFALPSQEDTPPAFEKIYVQRNQVVSMPDGIYYQDQDGNFSKAMTVLHDYDGMYVLTIKEKCPCCGRCYTGMESDDDEWGCPVALRRIHPRIWAE